MKSYKDFLKKHIGGSDIAALIIVGIAENGLLKSEILHFGEDGDYKAYVVTEPAVKIGSHYKLIATFKAWLKVYDDEGLTATFEADEIRVYRAAERGCIIHLI